MPLKIFCPSCYSSIEYNLKKPQFCTDCGKPLTISQANIQSKSTIIHNSKPEVESDEIEIIEDIEFHGSVESMGENKGIKFEELAKQSKTGFNRPKNKKVSIKKELEIFKAEASKPARIDMSDGGIE